MKFNQDLAAIHSYLCADGYVIKNPENQKHKYYHIGLRNTSNALLLDFQTRFKKIFGIKPFICKDGRCRIQNKEIYNFLTSKFSYYSYEWQMPKLSKRNLSIWLRAFFDCEAWVFVKKGQDRRIGLDSVNKNGLFDIEKALLKFKITSVLNPVKNRNIYRLYIYGRSNLENFSKKIGFLHPEKKTKLEEAINSYVDYEWNFLIDGNVREKFLTKIIKERAKFKRPNTLRFNSIIKKNLIQLSKLLDQYFSIKSKIYARKNKHSEYFELAVYGKENVQKLLNFRKVYK